MSKILNIKVDYKAKEISVIEGESVIRFFYHKEFGKFIVFRKGIEYCEIEDIKFTQKETRKLRKLIDSFIKSRFISINEKSNSRGTKRIIRRAKDSN